MIWNSAGVKRESYGFGGRGEASASGPGSPRTDVLGHSHAVPTGLISLGMVTQHCVLGYFQPSLWDCPDTR
jgi:hypothetical protein